MNKRKLSLSKYGISGKRYKELCGFCEQYPEWKKELDNRTYISGVEITDMPSAPLNNADRTAAEAVKYSYMAGNCKVIEDTAKKANEDIWKYIIDSVCYEVPLTYMESVGIPCSRSAFYDARRYFFFLLDKAKR